MDVDDRAAFGLEIQRLKQAGLAVPPSVRGAWALVLIADVVMIGATITGAVVLGSACMVLPFPSTVGFVMGLAAGFAGGLALRRAVLRNMYRALAARLEGPVPGAVGGLTSAAFPALYSGPPPPPTPPAPLRQQDVVRPVRVGDPDAEDFDD